MKLQADNAGGLLTRREVRDLDKTLRAIYNDPAAGRVNQNRARRALLTIKKAGRRTAGKEQNLFNNSISTIHGNT